MATGWTRRDWCRGVVLAPTAGVLYASRLASPTLAHAARDVPARLLSGHWKLVNRDDATARVKQGIEAAVEDMNVMIRGLARRRLHETVLPPPSIELDFHEGLVRMVGARGKSATIRVDGRARPWAGDRGEKVEISAWWRGDTFVRRFDGRGRREDRLRVVDEGAGMQMRTVISASLMPTPVRFALRFRRVSAPAK